MVKSSQATQVSKETIQIEWSEQTELGGSRRSGRCGDRRTKHGRCRGASRLALEVGEAAANEKLSTKMVKTNFVFFLPVFFWLTAITRYFACISNWSELQRCKSFWFSRGKWVCNLFPFPFPFFCAFSRVMNSPNHWQQQQRRLLGRYIPRDSSLYNTLLMSISRRCGARLQGTREGRVNDLVCVPACCQLN